MLSISRKQWFLFALTVVAVAFLVLPGDLPIVGASEVEGENGIQIEPMESDEEVGENDVAYEGALAELAESLIESGVPAEKVKEVVQRVEAAVGDRFGEGAERQLVYQIVEAVFSFTSDSEDTQDAVERVVSALETVSSVDRPSLNKPKLTEIAKLLAAAEEAGLDVEAISSEIAAKVEAEGSIEQVIRSIEAEYGLDISKAAVRSREARERHEEKAQVKEQVRAEITAERGKTLGMALKERNKERAEGQDDIGEVDDKKEAEDEAFQLEASGDEDTSSNAGPIQVQEQKESKSKAISQKSKSSSKSSSNTKSKSSESSGKSKRSGRGKGR